MLLFRSNLALLLVVGAANLVYAQLPVDSEPTNSTGGHSGGGGGALPPPTISTITIQPNMGGTITLPGPRPTNIAVPPNLLDELPSPPDSPVTGSPNFPSENNAGRRRIVVTTRQSSQPTGTLAEDEETIPAPTKKKKAAKAAEDNGGGIGTAGIVGIVLGSLGLVLFVVAAVARWTRKGRDRRYREPTFTELEFNQEESNPFRPVHEADPFKRHLYHAPQQNAGVVAPAHAYQPYK